MKKRGLFCLILVHNETYLSYNGLKTWLSVCLSSKPKVPWFLGFAESLQVLSKIHKLNSIEFTSWDYFIKKKDLKNPCQGLWKPQSKVQVLWLCVLSAFESQIMFLRVSESQSRLTAPLVWGSWVWGAEGGWEHLALIDGSVGRPRAKSRLNYTVCVS